MYLGCTVNQKIKSKPVWLAGVGVRAKVFAAKPDPSKGEAHQYEKVNAARN